MVVGAVYGIVSGLGLEWGFLVVFMEWGVGVIGIVTFADNLLAAVGVGYVANLWGYCFVSR